MTVAWTAEDTPEAIATTSHLGGIKRIKVRLVLLLWVHELNVEGPLRVVATGNGVVQVMSESGVAHVVHALGLRLSVTDALKACTWMAVVEASQEGHSRG